MKRSVLTVLLFSAAYCSGQTTPAQEKPTPTSGCLIVKHKGTIGRRLMWTALIGVPIAPGSKYDYVDSFDYKNDKLAYGAKDLQAIEKKGVKVVLLENKYKPEDLESARKSCQATPAPVTTAAAK